MGYDKGHKEFHGVDMKEGFHTVPGYPWGFSEKILAGSLDEKNKVGNRTRILKIEPGAFSTVPFVHEYWEEVFLVSGDLVCGSDAQGKGGESFTGPTYCVRPPGVLSRTVHFEERLPAAGDALLRAEVAAGRAGNVYGGRHAAHGQGASGIAARRPRGLCRRRADRRRHPPSGVPAAAQTVAGIYDMKADPANRDSMTYEEDGGRHSIYFLRPKTRDDLQRRIGRPPPASPNSPTACSAARRITSRRSSPAWR